MSYYKMCEYCGAALDPCEVCDCKKEKAAVSTAIPTAAPSSLITEATGLNIKSSSSISYRAKHIKDSISEDKEKSKMISEMLLRFIDLDIDCQRKALLYIEGLSES